MLIETGKTYVSRNGRKVGPMRPFVEGKDPGASEDIMGRLAWFTADNAPGNYDKHGNYLTGWAHAHPHDLTSEYGAGDPANEEPAPAPAVREVSGGILTPFGVLMADAKIAEGFAVTLRRAWLEPASAPDARIYISPYALEATGRVSGGEWRSDASQLRALIQEEAIMNDAAKRFAEAFADDFAEVA